jgi:protoporphyrinogen oxidase
MSRRVAILGAGLAGLASARYLSAHGWEATVYEAGPQVAGMASSHKDPDGFTYDFGAHFITNRLAAAVGCSSLCRIVRRYGETVRLGRRNISYPGGLLASPRFLASAIRSRLFQRGQPKNAADWYRRTYGKALADDVAIPLTEAWSGQPAETLSAAVGDKIPGSIAETLLLKFAQRAAKVAVAVGYCGTLPQSASVWHVYPEGGLGTLCEGLAAGMRDQIRTRSPVEAILVDGGRVRGVRVQGTEIPAEAVVTTAPVHVLPKLVQGTDQLDYLRKFRYRAMTFVNLRLKGRGLLPDVVVWTPAQGYPFFRLTETTLSMPWLAPEGWTIITCDIGCEVGDSTWKMSDDELAELCLPALERIVPDVRARFEGLRVLRVPLAYPIYALDYEADRRRFEQGTGIGGLYSIGRNGEFRHILMEDVFWRMRAILRPLIDKSPAAARSE